MLHAPCAPAKQQQQQKALRFIGNPLMEWLACALLGLILFEHNGHSKQIIGGQHVDSKLFLNNRSNWILKTISKKKLLNWFGNDIISPQVAARMLLHSKLQQLHTKIYLDFSLITSTP